MLLPEQDAQNAVATRALFELFAEEQALHHSLASPFKDMWLRYALAQQLKYFSPALFRCNLLRSAVCCTEDAAFLQLIISNAKYTFFF